MAADTSHVHCKAEIVNFSAGVVYEKDSPTVKSSEQKYKVERESASK